MSADANAVKVTQINKIDAIRQKGQRSIILNWKKSEARALRQNMDVSVVLELRVSKGKVRSGFRCFRNSRDWLVGQSNPPIDCPEICVG